MATQIPAREAAPLQRLRRMDANENPRGASPQALAAARAVLEAAAHYPDAAGNELKAALAARFGVAPEGLVLGNGSSELLELAARCFLGAGDEAVLSQYSFIGYPHAIKMAGATGIVVPARDFGHDLAAMAAAITPRTKLVFVANPNNPTGTFLAQQEIVAFLERVPGHVVVVLDEAYSEYLPPEKRMNAFALLARFANLVVVRTFSKAHGLAGLRVGFAAARAALAEPMNRARLVFNVNAPAQAAARAALQDEAFLSRVYRDNREGMDTLAAALQELGVPFVESWGNFLAADFSGAPGGPAAVHTQLQAQGFLVKPLGGYGLPDHLRITIGLAEDNAALARALRACLRPAAG